MKVRFSSRKIVEQIMDHPGVALGWIPLAFGLGRLSRGVAAQKN